MRTVTPDSAETRRLLDEAGQGQDEAFNLLFERHRSLLLRVVELRLDNRVRARVDPSDVVQDTYLEAFRRLPDFLKRAPMPFHLWLRKTAQERALMTNRQHLGASRRSVDRELPLPEYCSADLARQLLAAGPTPSQQAAQGELSRLVGQAVAKLPVADREVLLMRTFEGLPYGEIAGILGIDPAAARKRHGRALLRLHELLVGNGLAEAEV
jgi:RNA polymerase sigma-70 factor (ECF subfamily)